MNGSNGFRAVEGKFVLVRSRDERPRLRWWVPVVVGVLVFVPAFSQTAIAAVLLHAPSTAKLESRISVTASGLAPGRYSLVLSRSAGPTTCLAVVAVADAAAGKKVGFSGTLPKRLSCYLGRNSTFGGINLTAGTYWLTVGEFVPPAGFDTSAGFAKTPIKLVG
jgi:hypothetical protein